MSNIIIDPDYARKSHFIFKSYFDTTKLQQHSNSRPWAPAPKMPQASSRSIYLFNNSFIITIHFNTSLSESQRIETSLQKFMLITAKR